MPSAKSDESHSKRRNSELGDHCLKRHFSDYYGNFEYREDVQGKEEVMSESKTVFKMS